MASNAIAAKAAVKALIDELTDLRAIMRTWGMPGGDPERRWVVVGDVKWLETNWATDKSRREQFTVKVVVNCQISGASAEEVEEQVMAYSGAFEDALKADPRLGIGSVTNTSWQPISLDSWPITDGYEGQLEANVYVDART